MSDDHQDLRAKGKALLSELKNADPAQRHALLPALESHLSTCRSAGMPVPPQLAEIEQTIHDEEIEDYFDNLPV